MSAALSANLPRDTCCTKRLACSLYGGSRPLCTSAVKQFLHDRFEDAVCPLAHLVGGEILHRMRHTDDGESRHAKGLCLRTRGVEKDLRGQDGGGNLALFKSDPVVHTARRARASVGKRLDDHIAATG